MTRLYADENFPFRVVEELRRLGYDVLTAFQAISDEDLLDRATEAGRAVITLNRVDFKRLHPQHPEHAGTSFVRKTRIRPVKQGESRPPWSRQAN